MPDQQTVVYVLIGAAAAGLLLWKLGYLDFGGEDEKPKKKKKAKDRAEAPDGAARFVVEHLHEHVHHDGEDVKGPAEPTHETEVTIPMRITVTPQAPKQQQHRMGFPQPQEQHG